MANPRSLADSTALRDETVLRRVRQFGSARNGLQEWRLQRLTQARFDLRQDRQVADVPQGHERL